MSITITKTLVCDGCYTWVYETTDESAAAEMRLWAARMENWTHKRNKDYCPKCTERLEK